MMIRRFFLLLILGTTAAQAQTQVIQTTAGVSPVLEVQRLAPQLVQFAGGELNFQNLVNGLAFGLPVTLTTALAPGVTQIVSFAPVGTMSASQIAQTLENARQLAIANGIAAPSAQQLGVILNGGALPTATGTTTVNGLVGGTSGTSVSTQLAPAAALQSGRSFNVRDSPFGRGVSDSPRSGVSTTLPATGAATGVSAATTPPAVRVIPGGAIGGGTTARFGVAR